MCMNAGIFCASYPGILVCTEYNVTCASGILVAFLPAVALSPNRRKTYQTEVRTKTPSLISTVSPPFRLPPFLFFFFFPRCFFCSFCVSVVWCDVCPPSLPPAVFSFIFLSVVWCVSRSFSLFFFVFPLSLSFSFLQTRQRQKGGLLEGREATDETGIVVLAAPGHLGGRTDLAGTVEAAATATTARPMSMVSLRLSPPPRPEEANVCLVVENPTCCVSQHCRDDRVFRLTSTAMHEARICHPGQYVRVCVLCSF